MANLAQLAYLSYAYKTEKALQVEVQTWRDYYEGDHTDFLSKELADFLQVEPRRFSLNLCRQPVSSIEERLSLHGFSASGGSQPATTGDELSAFAQFLKTLYDNNNLAILQSTVHEAMLRDGEAFVIVNPAPAGSGRLPDLTFHPRYVGVEQGGDGEGCKAKYTNDDTEQPLEYVSRRWFSTDAEGKPLERFNVYYPNKIEKYKLEKGQPVEMRDEGDTAWPLPWVSDGKPIGIPIVHFAMPGFRSELRDAVPVQDVINMTVADMLGSARVAGFRIVLLSGMIPTKDNLPLAADHSNALKLRPGVWMMTLKKPGEVGLSSIEGENPEPIVSLINNQLAWFAMVTGLPLTRFQMTGNIASQETQKEYMESLITRTAKIQMRLGRSWVRCASIAAQLEAVFGSSANVDLAASISADWRVTRPKDEVPLTDRHDKLKVPIKTVWRESGYTEEQIAQMWQDYMDEQTLLAQIAAGGFQAPLEDDTEDA